MSNTPKIRFREYFENWEKIKFGDIYAIASGFAFKKDDYVKKGVLLVNGESIQHGTISSGNWNYLPSEFLNKYKAFLLKTDDIVLGLNRPITNKKLKIAKVSNELNNSLLYQRAGRVEFKTDISKEFSYQIIENEVYKFVKKEAVGSDQPFISTQKLAKWSFFYTGNTKEQIKIGLFFKQLDETIILQQQLLNDHKQLKKAMLQKLFPQKSEKIPEIRFSEFSDSWEEKILGEIGVFQRGNNLSKKDIKNSGKYKCILYGELFTIYKEVISSVVSYTNKEIRNPIIAYENDILFPASTTANALSLINPSAMKDNNVLIGGDICLFRPQDNTINSEFLSYAINGPFRYEISKYAEGTTIIHIYNSELKKVKINIPSILEQEKIARLLSKIDEKIELSITKIETYQELKKAMLQKMFV